MAAGLAAVPLVMELLVNLMRRGHHLIMRLRWQGIRHHALKVVATPTIATPSRDVIIRLAELNVAKHFKFMPPRYPFLHPCPPMGGQVESKIPSQLDLHDADFLCVKKPAMMTF